MSHDFDYVVVGSGFGGSVSACRLAEKGYSVVTDDANRLPLYVESPLSVGYVKVYLTDFSGLRNPMDAKVK